ncbi:hypothetical protein LH425_11460 [Laribacter hongkongensis]|uniref:hypothetical protein n=1 Tax=Laribacter hongkongensis TaxID=168471 RepID=UPI001EFC97B5|nr:hypothetical protein [Laribacter hongkongensis]MCG9065642.1 hypothetical protein [Laribacter hongkongensis]
MVIIPQLPLFKEISHQDQCYRLEWMGGICTNLGDPSNPLLECFFTPVNPVSGRRDFSNQIRAGIAIGYLPTLFLGQTFQGNNRRPRFESAPARLTLRLDLQQPGAVEETSLLSIDTAARFDPVHQRFLKPRADHESSTLRAGLKRLQGTVVNTHAQTDAPTVILVPELELLRFYYVSSEYMAKLIFTGHFGRQSWAESTYNLLHEEPSYDLESGVARFVYRLGFSRDDVPVLARILFEGGDRWAQRGVYRPGKLAIAQRINAAGSSSLFYPRTRFPFMAQTTLELTGSYWNLKTNHPVFLVHQILSCSGPFPFKGISYCEEVGKGGKPAGSDAPVAFPGRRRRHLSGNSTPGQGLSTDPPAGGVEKQLFEATARKFIGLQGVPIVREKRRDCTHQADGGSSGPVEHLPHSSTGNPTQGNTSAKPLTIKGKTLRPSAVPANLDAFLEALDVLNNTKPEWRMETIPAGLDGFYDEARQAWFSLFPMVPCEKRTLHLRQFSFMDDEQTEQRRLVCAQLTIGKEQYVYLLDAERRERKQSERGQSPYMDVLPIALLHTLNYAPIDDDLFDKILIAAVKKTTWPLTGGIEGIVRDDTRHSKGAKDVRDIAARMITLVLRHCDLARSP